MSVPAKNKGMYKVEFQEDDVPYREVAPGEVVLVGLIILPFIYLP